MEPILAVIKAKKSDSVVKSSAWQLIAQLLCIQHKEYESRYSRFLNPDGPSNKKRAPVGLLTDGEVWRIYFLQPYNESAVMMNEKLWEEGGVLYMSRKIFSNTEDGKKQLLGILSPDFWAYLGLLVHLISGFRPSLHMQGKDKDAMPPIWLRKKGQRTS